MRKRDFCLSLLGLAALSAGTASARPGRLRVRVMSISNAYAHVAWPPRLDNATPDGELFAQAADDLPYTFSVSRIRDAGFDELKRRHEAFVADLQPNDTVLFHYAGHAVQLNGSNYLLTDDAADLVNMQTLLGDYSGAGARPVIAFLDCCRNNPFSEQPPQTGEKLTVHRGLAAARRDAEIPEWARDDVNAETAWAAYDALKSQSRNGLTEFDLGDANIFVMFATAPRRTARDYVVDGDPHSPFTAAIAHRLQQQVGLNELAQLISQDVSRMTRALGDERQIPWRSASLQGSEIYLAGRPRYGGGLVQ